MADIIHLTEVHLNKKGSHQAKSGGTITMEDGRVLPISKKERQKLEDSIKQQRKLIL